MIRSLKTKVKERWRMFVLESSRPEALVSPLDRAFLRDSDLMKVPGLALPSAVWDFYTN